MLNNQSGGLFFLHDTGEVHLFQHGADSEFDWSWGSHVSTLSLFNLVMINVCVNLGRLWCPVVWLNTSVDVAVKVNF